MARHIIKVVLIAPRRTCLRASDPQAPFLSLHKLIDEQILRETMSKALSLLPPMLR
jgi:hypothetical protein